MAEDEDRSSKTEAPTEKKLRDARDKGNVPHSREAVHAVGLIAVVVAASYMVPNGAGEFIAVLSDAFVSVGSISLSPSNTVDLFVGVGYALAAFLGPLLVVLIGVALAASFAQNMPQISGESLKPQLSRISLISGFSRIFGPKGLAEFGKSTFKITLVCIAALLLTHTLSDIALTSLLTDPRQLPGLVQHATLLLMVGIAVPVVVLAALDLVIVRRFWLDELKMSRRDIKDELKQSEGDPILRSRLRSLQQDRARRRMIAQIPTATVVITNPTHLAIALRYRDGVDPAPMVVGKGADIVAKKIREIAEEHRIAMVENRPLAWSLYENVPVDATIPAELYSAVAEVLIAVRRADQRRSPQLAPDPTDPAGFPE